MFIFELCWLQFEESTESTEFTPEEELAEKLKLKKLQEDSDLELAKDVFGECCLYYYNYVIYLHILFTACFSVSVPGMS